MTAIEEEELKYSPEIRQLAYAMESMSHTERCAALLELANEQHGIGMNNGRFGYVPKSELTTLSQQHEREIAEARETALKDAQKAIADVDYKNPIARQCWYAVDALRPHKYVAASSNREEEA